MDLVRAIEDNTADLLMALGTAGGGTQRDDGVARWTIGGSPLDYHNAVVALGASPEQAIAESAALLRQYAVPGTWHVGPSMTKVVGIGGVAPNTPTEAGLGAGGEPGGGLGGLLVAAGFVYDGSEPGMALVLEELVAPHVVPGLVVERVVDDAGLGVWEGTLGRGFGEGPVEAAWVASVYRRLGYDDPWRHYVGFLDGEAVGTATVYLTGDVAGVYFVMTVPEVRRRGIGAAITHAALAQAGTKYAVLTSSAAGRSVYSSLGFRQYCTVDLYRLDHRSPAATGRQ